MRATINIYKYNDNEFLCIDEITALNSEYNDYSKAGNDAYLSIVNSDDSAFSKVIKTTNLKEQMDRISKALIRLEDILITLYNSSEKQIANHQHSFIFKPFVRDIVNTNILVNSDNKCYISLKNLQECNIWTCKYYKHNDLRYTYLHSLIYDTKLFDVQYKYLLIID